jgi:DNA-binding HxlR family transcriptional regulator
MARETRTYGHFCVLARALEQVDDRWTLLVVRDLLVAPRRFTDLMDRLGGITPKTLSLRLKQLETAGIVRADREPGRREVWYELTEAGRDLAPALRELARWGMRHAQRPREPGERLHAEHLLSALRVVLAGTKPPKRAVQWCFRFTDDGVYTMRFDGAAWTLTPEEADDPDVVVTAASADWARYLGGDSSPRERSAVDIAGARPAVEAFQRLIARFPDAMQRAG